MVNTKELYSKVLESWEKRYARLRAKYYYIECTTGTIPEHASEHLEAMITKINFYKAKLENM